jgi:hypothetical protein
MLNIDTAFIMHPSSYINLEYATGIPKTHAIHQIPLHDQKFDVYINVKAGRIIGTIFFYNAVHSESYVNSLLEAFMNLPENERGPVTVF